MSLQNRSPHLHQVVDDGRSASGERVLVRSSRSRPSSVRQTRAVLSMAVACTVAFVAGGGRPGQASDQSSGLSIGGAQLPNLRPALPAAGLAAGAPGLPDAAATLERVAPGTHGVPPTVPGVAPQVTAPTAPPNSWSEAEVRGAQVRCQRALAGLDAQYSFIPQVKSGACGTPAAIELSGFGKGLAISPPIIVSCDIAAALQTWMRSHVQPIAKRHLATSIVQINTMSSYACRNRYGAKNAPLSQHAFANAIDIQGLRDGQGTTSRRRAALGADDEGIGGISSGQPGGGRRPDRDGGHS